MQSQFDGLPVREDSISRKFGFATRLVPVYRGESQIAWKEVEVSSPVIEVREQAHTAPSVPVYVPPAGKPWLDYDPILEDYKRWDAA